MTVKNYRRLRAFIFEPREHMNILVGENEAGKSTVLEAIGLALSGRVNGRWAGDEVNPFWFNRDAASAFFEDHAAGKEVKMPEIYIELYMRVGTPGAEKLRGNNNDLSEDCPGLKLRIKPDPDQAAEIAAYLAIKELPKLIPTELYVVEWKSFANETITRQPAGLGYTAINMGTARGTSQIDYKMRQLLRDFVTPAESVKIALDYRRARDSITEGTLKAVDERIALDGGAFGVGLQMDQSSSSHWESTVTPHIANIPFALLGQGKQVATRLSLAMSKKAATNQIVLIEEPEINLSHTSLQQLLGQISTLAGGRQLFVTTHSSFVLNRLGFSDLFFMTESALVAFDERLVAADTIKYFRLQSGYDTLRLVLAERTVVVEGPSDEMIFNAAFKAVKGVEPRERGVDVVALGTPWVNQWRFCVTTMEKRQNIGSLQPRTTWSQGKERCSLVLYLMAER
jgi:putative ATP-dependent endonuclease of OLD family